MDILFVSDDPEWRPMKQELVRPMAVYPSGVRDPRITHAYDPSEILNASADVVENTE